MRISLSEFLFLLLDVENVTLHYVVCNIEFLDSRLYEFIGDYI